MIFADTSVFLALANPRDPNHESAEISFNRIGESGEVLLTHNYVLVESIALIHRRLGLSAALRFGEESRMFELQWVGPELHTEALERLARSRNRGIGFVDQVSFLVMRERRITTAFAFDKDFADEGFSLYR